MDVFLVGSSVMLGESSGCVYQTYSHKSREIDTNSTFEFGRGRTVERRASASIGRRLSRAPLLPPNVSQVHSRPQLRHLGASGLCVPLSFTDGLSAVADLFVGFDHPTAAGGGHTKRPPLFLAGASLVPAQLRVAWNSLAASYKSPCGFFLPSTASPKAALRRSVVVRSKMVTVVSSRTGEVPGACPHGPSAPVKPNRLYCQLQPNAAVSELSSFVSQLCLIGG